MTSDEFMTEDQAKMCFVQNVIRQWSKLAPLYEPQELKENTGLCQVLKLRDADVGTFHADLSKTVCEILGLALTQPVATIAEIVGYHVPRVPVTARERVIFAMTYDAVLELKRYMRNSRKMLQGQKIAAEQFEP